MRVTIFLLVGVFCLSGCESLSKRHATRAILFAQEKDVTQKQSTTEQPKDDTNFVIAPQKSPLYSGNPVFIHNNTKFSIRIDEINPGWIYREKPTKSSRTSNANSKGGSGSATSSNPYHPISREQFDHFRGHELWLLVTVSSLNVNDPLETKSKRYFKATNVKFDAQSYSLIPLDSEEKYIFTHESDSSYRVKFQLFKVSEFSVKKELAKISKNPGIIGAGKAVLETLKNTAGSLAGDVIQSLWDDKASEALALERFLLSAGATMEFNGELVVLRDGDFQKRIASDIFLPDESKAIQHFLGIQNKPQIKNFKFAKPFVENQYLLVDLFKHMDKKNVSTFKMYEEQSSDSKLIDSLEKLSIKDGNVSGGGNYVENAKLSKFAYLKLSVLESYSAKSYIDDKGNIRFSQVPESYQNDLTALSGILQDTDVQKLQENIANIEIDKPHCLTDVACLNKKEEEIKETEKKIQALKQAKPELQRAIERYKQETRLDEWTAHVSRQPD